MKSFVGYIANKIVKATPRSKKVAPTIKSVKPTKDIKGSVKRVYRAEESKRMDQTAKSKGKIDEGKKMMREGQKELKKMVDTGKAFKFKHGTTRQKTFAITPGKDPKKEYKGLIEESKPTKKFKTGKELAREKKMGGGMMGRRFGMKSGTNPFKKETDVDKIKKAFAPKGKNLKPVDPKKQKGLAKLPRAVRNKMGYMKKGGRAGFKGGSDMSKKPATETTKAGRQSKIERAQKRMKAAFERNQGRSFGSIMREKYMR